jgi:hypothetical protein
MPEVTTFLANIQVTAYIVGTAIVPREFSAA